jgi:hypothetical protein
LKGLLFFLASSCILASVVLPNALGAGGGKTIASAPTLRVGVRVGDSHKLPGCSNSFTTSGYGEIWRIPLRRGDQLRLVYGSKDSNPVQILLLDPAATDENTTAADVLDQAWTYQQDDIAYTATKAGRYSILVRTFYGCQNGLAYYLTAQVRHAAKV